MKIKDLIVAVKEYPRILQALEETKSELDASQSECTRLLEQLNELEPLADEYYQQSCSKEYAANQERKKTEKLKTMLASFGPTLDSADIVPWLPFINEVACVTEHIHLVLAVYCDIARFADKARGSVCGQQIDAVKKRRGGGFVYSVKHVIAAAL